MKTPKASYEDIASTVQRIIIEELCSGGGVAGASARIIQIVTTWARTEDKYGTWVDK